MGLQQGFVIKKIHQAEEVEENRERSPLSPARSSKNPVSSSSGNDDRVG